MTLLPHTLTSGLLVYPLMSATFSLIKVHISTTK